MTTCSKPERVGDLPFDGLHVLRTVISCSRSFPTINGPVELLHVISTHAGGEIRGYFRGEGSNEPYKVRSPNYLGEWPELDIEVARLVRSRVEP